MGKRSKRRSGAKSADKAQPPPALRKPELEETANLQFEDPFVDEYEKEDVVGVDDDEPLEEQQTELIATANPYLPSKEELEMEPSAYKMHHAIGAEWPSMTLDFFQDTWGDGRSRFPLSLLAAVGTCADAPEKNSVQILKLSDLSKLEQEEESDDELDDDNDSDDDESEQDLDYDPVLENVVLNHYGGVNRLRVSQTLVASWSETGKVHLYNVNVEGLCQESISMPSGADKKPFFTYSGHSTEGFAMDWSSSQRLATGDNDGNIHLWQHQDGTTNWSVTPTYASPNSSVEDIQWSPTESTVLAAAEANGTVKIYDTRAPNRHMLSQAIASTDVNALSWNKLVTNLLATGCDDGSWSVWDLRKFQPKEALARFTSHTTPITSMQWHPSDESMLVVSDDVGSFVYDLSIEEEDGGHAMDDEKVPIPPQLLFVHSGSPQTKEVRWHPQITSCLMSTAANGFSVFIPSNL